MLFIFLPLSIFGNFIDNNFLNLNFLEFRFKVTLLLFDYLLLLSLYFVTKEKSRKLLLIIFWLSPITIYCNYIYGAIDIIPISILIFSIHLIKLNKYIYSGFFFGIAVTSKFSMLIALPFIFIYILKRRGLDKELNFFLFSFILISVMLNIPFLNSYGFKEMVLGTNSIDSLYSVYLSYGNNLKLYIVPVIYIFSLYLVWRLKRITIDLFFISIGIGFFSILVFLPPAPGWILWVIPFLIYYQITSKKDIFLICIVYNIIYIINVFNLSKIMNEDDFFSHLLMLKENSFSLKDSLLFTLQQSLGLLLAVRMYIYGLVRNNFYSLSNNALLISLSGNEKEKIYQFITSLRNLIYDKDLFITSLYDSSAKEISKDNTNINLGEQKDAYFVNFLSKNINRVNTDLVENPKTYQFLLNEKNEDLSVLEKDINLEVFINKYNSNNLNQEYLFEDKNLPLIFNFKKISKNIFSIITFFPLGFLHTKFFNLLISISSLNVDIELLGNKKIVRMEIEGNPSKEDIYQIASNLITEIDDLSLKENFWSSGYIGIMQIVLFANLAAILKKTKISY